VIVTAGGTRTSLRTCLAALRPTLRAGDEVVCVVPAGRAELRAELGGARWLTVLDSAPADQADRWAAGLAGTTHPVVVFLDGDVCVSAHWLDPVVAVFDDPQVVAAGPRCSLSFGPQAVDLPEHAGEGVAAFQRHARTWRQDHRSESTDVDRLGPVCAAFRRSALDRAGGPTADLPYGRLRTQGRIVRVDGALVTHLDVDGCAQRAAVLAGAPLLSASLIVRDEEGVLANCLASLAGFVDEIVVYDTGSTDRTREIAREHGAIVVEGRWDDHFGDARNRALAHCHGSWILHIDADEVLTVADPAAAHAAIRGAAAAAFAVPLEGLHHDEAQDTYRVRVVRLFRRDRGRYAGRLHEQIVDRVTGRPLPTDDLAGVTLTHHGYTRVQVLAKDKIARNARLARLALDDGLPAREVYFNLARSYSAAGDHDAAIDACRTALSAGTGGARVFMMKTLISALLSAGRLDEADAVLDDLRRMRTAPVTAFFVEARIRYLRDDLDRALAIVQKLPASVNEDGLEAIGRDQLADIEVNCLSRLGRHAEAADRLRDLLRTGQLPVSVARAAEILTAAGSGIAEVAGLLPPDRLRGIRYAVSEAPETVADELLDALWVRYPDEPVVLALAAAFGWRLPLMRALEWSFRLRRHGLADSCPLVALAGAAARTPRDRALAAAAAVELFADEAALSLLSVALADVPAGQNDLVLAELMVLAPGVAATVEPAEAGT
jgi:pentatricopeptide repeat protein